MQPPLKRNDAMGFRCKGLGEHLQVQKYQFNDITLQEIRTAQTWSQGKMWDEWVGRKG